MDEQVMNGQVQAHHQGPGNKWEGPFQAPWIIWVIRLISPHLPN